MGIGRKFKSRSTKSENRESTSKTNDEANTSHTNVKSKSLNDASITTNDATTSTRPRKGSKGGIIRRSMALYVSPVMPLKSQVQSSSHSTSPSTSPNFSPVGITYNNTVSGVYNYENKKAPPQNFMSLDRHMNLPNYSQSLNQSYPSPMEGGSSPLPPSYSTASMDRNSLYSQSPPNSYPMAVPITISQSNASITNSTICVSPKLLASSPSYVVINPNPNSSFETSPVLSPTQNYTIVDDNPNRRMTGSSQRNSIQIANGNLYLQNAYPSSNSSVIYGSPTQSSSPTQSHAVVYSLPRNFSSGNLSQSPPNQAAMQFIPRAQTNVPPTQRYSLPVMPNSYSIINPNYLTKSNTVDNRTSNPPPANNAVPNRQSSHHNTISISESNSIHSNGSFCGLSINGQEYRHNNNVTTAPLESTRASSTRKRNKSNSFSFTIPERRDSTIYASSITSINSSNSSFMLESMKNSSFRGASGVPNSPYPPNPNLSFMSNGSSQGSGKINDSRRLSNHRILPDNINEPLTPRSQNSSETGKNTSQPIDIPRSNRSSSDSDPESLYSSFSSYRSSNYVMSSTQAAQSTSIPSKVESRPREQHSLMDQDSNDLDNDHDLIFDLEHTTSIPRSNSDEQEAKDYEGMPLLFNHRSAREKSLFDRELINADTLTSATAFSNLLDSYTKILNSYEAKGEEKDKTSKASDTILGQPQPSTLDSQDKEVPPPLKRNKSTLLGLDVEVEKELLKKRNTLKNKDRLVADEILRKISITHAQSVKKATSLKKEKSLPSHQKSMKRNPSDLVRENTLNRNDSNLSSAAKSPKNNLDEATFCLETGDLDAVSPIEVYTMEQGVEASPSLLEEEKDRQSLNYGVNIFDRFYEECIKRIDFGDEEDTPKDSILDSKARTTEASGTSGTSGTSGAPGTQKAKETEESVEPSVAPKTEDCLLDFDKEFKEDFFSSLLFTRSTPSLENIKSFLQGNTLTEEIFDHEEHSEPSTAKPREAAVTAKEQASKSEPSSKKEEMVAVRNPDLAVVKETSNVASSVAQAAKDNPKPVKTETVEPKVKNTTMPKDLKASTEIKEIKDTKDTKDTKETKETNNSTKEPKEPKEINNSTKEIKEPKEPKEPTKSTPSTEPTELESKKIKETKELSVPKNTKEPRDINTERKVDPENSESQALPTPSSSPSPTNDCSVHPNESTVKEKSMGVPSSPSTTLSSSGSPVTAEASSKVAKAPTPVSEEVQPLAGVHALPTPPSPPSTSPSGAKEVTDTTTSTVPTPAPEDSKASIEKVPAKTTKTSAENPSEDKTETAAQRSTSQDPKDANQDSMNKIEVILKKNSDRGNNILLPQSISDINEENKNEKPFIPNKSEVKQLIDRGLSNSSPSSYNLDNTPQFFWSSDVELHTEVHPSEIFNRANSLPERLLGTIPTRKKSFAESAYVITRDNISNSINGKPVIDPKNYIRYRRSRVIWEHYNNSYLQHRMMSWSSNAIIRSKTIGSCHIKPQGSFTLSSKQKDIPIRSHTTDVKGKPATKGPLTNYYEYLTPSIESLKEDNEMLNEMMKKQDVSSPASTTKPSPALEVPSTVPEEPNIPIVLTPSSPPKSDLALSSPSMAGRLDTKPSTETIKKVQINEEDNQIVLSTTEDNLNNNYLKTIYEYTTDEDLEKIVEENSRAKRSGWAIWWSSYASQEDTDRLKEQKKMTENNNKNLLRKIRHFGNKNKKNKKQKKRSSSKASEVSTKPSPNRLSPSPSGKDDLKDKRVSLPVPKRQSSIPEMKKEKASQKLATAKEEPKTKETSYTQSLTPSALLSPPTTPPVKQNKLAKSKLNHVVTNPTASERPNKAEKEEDIGYSSDSSLSSFSSLSSLSSLSSSSSIREKLHVPSIASVPTEELLPVSNHDMHVHEEIFKDQSSDFSDLASSPGSPLFSSVLKELPEDDHEFVSMEGFPSPSSIPEELLFPTESGPQEPKEIFTDPDLLAGPSSPQLSTPPASPPPYADAMEGVTTVPTVPTMSSVPSMPSVYGSSYDMDSERLNAISMDLQRRTESIYQLQLQLQQQLDHITRQQEKQENILREHQYRRDNRLFQEEIEALKQENLKCLQQQKLIKQKQMELQDQQRKLQMEQELLQQEQRQQQEIHRQEQQLQLQELQLSQLKLQLQLQEQIKQQLQRQPLGASSSASGPTTTPSTPSYYDAMPSPKLHYAQPGGGMYPESSSVFDKEISEMFRERPMAGPSAAASPYPMMDEDQVIPDLANENMDIHDLIEANYDSEDSFTNNSDYYYSDITSNTEFTDSTYDSTASDYSFTYNDRLHIYKPEDDLPYARFNPMVEKALYQLSWNKLSYSKRSLHQQVVIRNLMIYYFTLNMENNDRSRRSSMRRHVPRLKGVSRKRSKR